MDRKAIFEQIERKRSFLCVGLDTDVRRLPSHLLAEADGNEGRAVETFNRAVIDATAPYTVAYKPNLAFYEALGAEGWAAFLRTVAYIRERYPDILVIADAKRGDIGNTSRLYARTFFETADVDAVTLSPYMGRDTAGPFLEYPGKWAVLLALTSNPSASDFELLETEGGRPLYERVLLESQQWGTPDNLMYVVGATRASSLERVRTLVPEHFLLVPGVGAQGGSLAEVAACGMNDRCGLLVNSSRGIIYAEAGERFDEAAGEQAHRMQTEMKQLLEKYL